MSHCINPMFPIQIKYSPYSENSCGDIQMDRVKRIWYLSPMRAAKVQASLRMRAVSPEPPLLAHTSSESRGTFRQKARSLAPLNSWACAVKMCRDGMLEDTNSLDGAQIYYWCLNKLLSNSYNEVTTSITNWISYESYPPPPPHPQYDEATYFINVNLPRCMK